MKRNITFLSLGMIFLYGLIPLSEALGQSHIVLDSGVFVSEEHRKSKWTLGFDVTSLSSFLLGGYTAENTHFGLQVTRLRNEKALRFAASLYPQAFGEAFELSHRTPIEVQGKNIVYQNRNKDGYIVRTSFGFEKGWSAIKWGRRYIGTDFTANLLQGNVGSSQMTRNSETGEILDLSSDIVYKSFTSIGPGISPFIGYEFRVWKRFGFNMELKADVSALFGDPIGFDLNGNIVRHRIFYDIRVFPMAEFRLRYRL